MAAIPSGRLDREWALCALAAAASRFVPVPLLDDVIKERALRTAVVRTWQAHGKPDAPDVIDILCDESTGFWAQVRGSVVRLPITLLLYPVRKAVRLVRAAREVGRDLAEVLLLARAVDRCLAAGWFDTADGQELRRQALQVRRAHDLTVGSADLRVVEHGLRLALQQVGGLRATAYRFARRAFGRDAADPATRLGTAGPDADRGAREVEAALRRPDVATVLADLDRRFDAALGGRTRAS